MEAFLDKDDGEIDREIELNLMAPLRLTKRVLPGMVDRRWGRIVSVASEAGRVGQRGQAAYSAAKAGLCGLTRSLAQEVGHFGVTVNAVSPAMTVPGSDDEIGEHSMQRVRERPPELMARIVKAYPVGRVGRPDDVAAAVGFLAGDAAGFITGQTLAVNGGFVTT